MTVMNALASALALFAFFTACRADRALIGPSWGDAAVQTCALLLACIFFGLCLWGAIP